MAGEIFGTGAGRGSSRPKLDVPFFRLIAALAGKRASCLTNARSAFYGIARRFAGICARNGGSKR
jgi:hypothetical protein